MKPSFNPAEDRTSSFKPEAMTEDWLRMHRLIEELSKVQKRIGTPLEQPRDFERVRGLGSDIREELDRLGTVEPFEMQGRSG
jgi:hypothetical protein